MHYIKHFGLYLLHCTWLRCIRSCMKVPSHGLLSNNWLVHNRFMSLGNPLEVVVHHLLIGEMVGLSNWDCFPIMSALVCMVTHLIGPMVSHHLTLSSSHDFTKLLYCVVSESWENIEFVLKLVVALTYRWDCNLIIHSL